tara:strand:- start:29 stop:580 length:552 start_codon:yes stop_codon:yes gene_type:complete
MFIFKKEKILDYDKCREAIRWFDKEGTGKPGKAGVMDLPNLEVCIQIYSQQDDNVENHCWGVGREVKKAMTEYIKKYPEINGLAKWKLTDLAQFARWEPGKYYHHLHCENEGKIYNKRFLSWMIFLNDIKEGGGTLFPQHNVRAEPKAGNFYIWPAGWTHLHIGEPAIKEKKYTITGWYEYVL